MFCGQCGQRSLKLILKYHPGMVKAILKDAGLYLYQEYSAYTLTSPLLIRESGDVRPA